MKKMESYYADFQSLLTLRSGDRISRASNEWKAMSDRRRPKEVPVGECSWRNEKKNPTHCSLLTLVKSDVRKVRSLIFATGIPVGHTTGIPVGQNLEP
jgi:hypothetical protein